MVLTKIGASLGGSADTLLVTQAGHGFVANDIGKAVKMLSTGLYALATADAIGNADVIGIILQRIDANTLLLALSGRVTVDAGVPTGDPGTVLFLPLLSTKTTNVGYLNSTEPSSAGEVSKPMAVITISGSEMILFQMRGEVISSGATANHTAASHSDVTATGAELNLLDGVTGLVQADFTKLAAVDSTAAELNKLDGAGVNVTAANLDTLTGTGATTLHSHAASGAAFPSTSVGFFFHDGMDSMFSSGVAGSGTKTYDTAGMLIYPGTTINSHIRMRLMTMKGGGTAGNVFSRLPWFRCNWYYSGDLGSDHTVFIGFAEGDIFASGAFVPTKDHLGFKAVRVSDGNVNLYATQADNSTEETSSVLTTLNTINKNIEVAFKVATESTGGSGKVTSCDYYYSVSKAYNSVPGWSPATNLTDNGARNTEANENILVGVSNDGTTENTEVRFLSAELGG